LLFIKYKSKTQNKIKRNNKSANKRKEREEKRTRCLKFREESLSFSLYETMRE